MMKFKDGSRISHQKAADLIRAELGGLITGFLYKDGLRCAGGVIIGSTEMNLWPKQPTDSWAWANLVNANNSFEGTPEERQEHMAQWFEARTEVSDERS